MADQSADEAELIALIHRNRIAIWTNDFDLWETCFVHEPYLTRWGWWRVGGVFVRQGFEELRQLVREDHPPRRDDFAYHTKVVNLMLRIDGNMAWATFDQQYPGTEAPGQIGSGLMHEMRVFERCKGEWKIAMIGLLDGDAGVGNKVAVQLDPEGTILWSNDAADQAIEASDDVVVRNRRIRFRDSQVNRKFQDALLWAASRQRAYMSNHGSMPLVVDGAEGEQTRIYWVIADAGQIMLSFGEQGLNAERLDLAALVYALSPAQKQLCAHVAQGLSLNEIAEKMSITANTARTHLQRVFDKTGVRTQPALVRVLLTAVAPL